MNKSVGVEMLDATDEFLAESGNDPLWDFNLRNNLIHETNHSRTWWSSLVCAPSLDHQVNESFKLNSGILQKNTSVEFKDDEIQASG